MLFISSLLSFFKILSTYDKYFSSLNCENFLLTINFKNDLTMGKSVLFFVNKYKI